MKDLLNELYQHKTLTREQAKNALIEVGEGKHTPSQLASFLTVFAMRSITIEELQGFRDAMLELCVKIDLKEFNAIDIVGTGGDGKDTFNISTLSSFVVAGAGINVSKHGNYGVSSSCGSSNVLEYLGIKFTNKEDKLKSQIEKSGFCMMHAPLFHPAMKYIAPIRKEMQVRTFFNILGPMINPSFAKHQFLGVFNLEILRLYGYLYQESDVNYSIVHAMDGYDEISLTSPVKVMDNKGEHLYQPSDFGFKQIQQKDIHGGSSVEASAKIFTNILNNNCTEAQKNVVLTNAGMAIKTVRQNQSIEESIAQARESLESGKALTVLQNLIN